MSKQNMPLSMEQENALLHESNREAAETIEILRKKRRGSGMKKYRIELTALELRQLQSVIGQGYGDGDHEAWLRDALYPNSRASVAALRRAMQKVDHAHLS